MLPSDQIIKNRPVAVPYQNIGAEKNGQTAADQRRETDKEVACFLIQAVRIVRVRHVTNCSVGRGCLKQFNPCHPVPENEAHYRVPQLMNRCPEPRRKVNALNSENPDHIFVGLPLQRTQDKTAEHKSACK